MTSLNKQSQFALLEWSIDTASALIETSDCMQGIGFSTLQKAFRHFCLLRQRHVFNVSMVSHHKYTILTLLQSAMHKLQDCVS
jgi:hypothetical protein